MRRRWQRMFVALALGHLGLVALGASYFDWDRHGALGKALAYYGEVTGAGNSYGFFAPGVGTDVRALFDVVDQRGRVTTEELHTGTSSEAELRTADVVEQFLSDGFLREAETDADTDAAADATAIDQASQEEEGDEDENEELVPDRGLYQALAASLVGTVLGRHPEARAVTFRLDEYDPVSMAEYRAGRRTDWQEIYRASFQRANTAAEVSP